MTESSMNWGGQEERSLGELRWLASQGHDTAVLCNQGSAIAQEAIHQGLSAMVHDIRYSASPLSIAQMVRAYLKFKPDVVNSHSRRHSWLAAWLHLAGVPVVRTQNIPMPDPWHINRGWLFRNGCRHVVAVSRDIQNVLIHQAKVPAERVSLVAEDVDCERFHPRNDGGAFRREINVGDETPLFGFVGMLRGEKGLPVLLKAARTALERTPEARFAIVGTPAASRDIENEAKAFIANNFEPGIVTMTGFREDIPAVMAAFDVLVVPSIREAQTMVAPQAMAVGRPVIASTAGGLPEIIDHGYNGFLVPPNDQAGLCERIVELATHPERRLEMGRNARAYAERHLRLEPKLAAMEEVFLRAIEN